MRLRAPPLLSHLQAPRAGVPLPSLVQQAAPILTSRDREDDPQTLRLRERASLPNRPVARELKVKFANPRGDVTFWRVLAGIIAPRRLLDAAGRTESLI